jgi:uncharacterized membrane protein YgcG
MEVEVEERISSDPDPETRDIEINNKLFLGDQIKINATVSESKLQNNVYEVVYIDLSTVHLNDKKTQQLVKLRIHDGEFADKIEDEDILEIQVVERKPTHKFVEQHDIKLNMILSVELALTPQQIRQQLQERQEGEKQEGEKQEGEKQEGEKQEGERQEGEGDKPLIITCKVIDVDTNQDMIEVKIILDDKDSSPLSSSFSPEIKEQLLKDSIFINFGCRGLPFWIKRIKVIEYKPSPSSSKPSNVAEDQTIQGEGQGEGEEEGDVGIDLDLSEALDEGNHIFANIMYEVPSSQKIVSEIKQYNDLLENIIASVPKHKRTEAELNSIHRNIERFFQLRKEYSTFDKNGVPKMPAHLTSADKPAVPHIQNLDKQLYWVLPVVENIKKLYVASDDAQEADTTNGIYSFKQQIIEEKGIYPDRNARYNPNIMNDLNSYLTPFENPKQNPDRTYIMKANPVHSNMLTLSTNNDTIVSRSKSKDVNAAIPSYIDRMYNTGLTKLEFEDVKSNSVKRVDSTPDDPAFVTSFMTLATPTVYLSQLLLPDTLLADQAALNAVFLKTWHSVISRILTRDDISSEIVRIEKKNGGSGGSSGDSSGDSSSSDRYQYVAEYKGSSPLFQDAMLFSSDGATSGGGGGAILKEFISSFVPTNEDAFRILEADKMGITTATATKTNRQPKTRLHIYLSLYKIIYALQPFLIYSKNVNVQQYDMMRAFIHKNIDNYFKKLQVSKSKFKKLVNKNDISAFESLEMFYNAFGDHDSKSSSSAKKVTKDALQTKIVLADDTTVTFDDIFKLYKFNELKRQDDIFLSTSEILKIILETDCARLFMDALAVENSDLTSSEIDSIIRKEQGDIADHLSKNASSSDAKTCKKREIILSKVYSSFAELEIDNNRENGDVLFDMRYDSSGKRHVKDGDYAALKSEGGDEGGEEGSEGSEGGYQYFVRRDNKWIKDDDPELQNVQLDDPSYFCNIPSETKPSPLCFSINQKCLDKSVAESSILQDLTARIVNEFDQKSEAKRKNIDEIFLFDLKNIKLLDKLKVYDILKYNKLKNDLAQENKKRVETIVSSPYQDTVNCILGLDDVALKYQCVLGLVSSELFVRAATPGDDVHWFYCKITGVRLLPTFFYELAQNYNPAEPKSSKYVSTLSRIEKSNGKREGDQIVDKFSGYAISKIAFVSESEWMATTEEEGGGGGGSGSGGGSGGDSETVLQLMRNEQQMASDVTSVNAGDIIEINIQNEGIQQTGTAAAILKEDEEEELEEQQKREEGEKGEAEEEKQYDFETAREEYETMLGVITHYENSLSIILKQKQKRFIIETIQLLIPAKKTREQYEIEKKTSVDYETYEKTYNQYLIFYCMALIIVVVQTSVPQIKTKSTFPNCVKSFEGYPYSADETNLAFVIYMACITQKVKNEYAPWNSVKKINQDKMRDTLFNLIKTKIINLPNVQAQFEAKRDHDALKKQREILKVNAKYRINDALFLFRPLLVNPSIVLASTPLPVTKTYCDDLKRNLKNGNSLQTENILVIESKIIHFSLLVQKLVQDVITAQTGDKGDKTKLLSRNYIQNACCNEKGDGDGNDNETVLQYMIRREPNIKNYCDMVECNADILHDVYSLSEAATMVDPKDTRNVIPELPSNFDEYTIYNAFMTYCNYGKHKGLKAATASAASAESAKKKKSASIKAKEKAKASASGEGGEGEGGEGEASGEGEEGGEGEARQESTSVSDDIHKICKFRNTVGENRDIFNILKSAKGMTHDNKLKLITQIKNEFNLDYTIKDLQHLLQLINGQTMKPMYQARVGTYSENLNRTLTQTLSSSSSVAITASLNALFSKDKDKDTLAALKAFNGNQTTERSRTLQRHVEQNSKLLTEQITTFLNMKNKGTMNAVFRTPSDIMQGVVTKGGIMMFHRTENTLLNGENNTLEVSVEFMKNAIKNITQVYPNMILTQVSEIESLPPYITGQLSASDASSILAFSNERVTKTLGNFYKIGNKKPVSNILKNVQSTTLLLNEIIENTPIYSGDNKHITVLLYEYYFLVAVYSYLHFSNAVKQFREKKAGQGQGQGQGQQALKQKTPIDVQKEVSRILTTYFDLILDDKKIMNRNIDTIRETYLRSLDDERDDIVQNVDQMSEDQKQIYLNHKKYKMGSQSIGKNAGLRIYNPDFETEELARIERINHRKKERGISSSMLSGDPDPEALAREYAVADEGDAPDYDPDEENEMQEDDAHEEYANSADMYPDSYVDVEGVGEFES